MKTAVRCLVDSGKPDGARFTALTRLARTTRSTTPLMNARTRGARVAQVAMSDVSCTLPS